MLRIACSQRRNGSLLRSPKSCLVKKAGIGMSQLQGRNLLADGGALGSVAGPRLLAFRASISSVLVQAAKAAQSGASIWSVTFEMVVDGINMGAA